jgi:hypothetical protein
MGDEIDYDYDVPDMNPSEDEAYFYHTLGDFESYVKDLGANYVLTEMSEDVRELLKGALND